MKRIFINVQRLQEKDSAHEYLQKRLATQEYYGRNLDALYDVLTSFGRDTTIYLMQERGELSDYAQRILETLQDAAEANLKLTIHHLS